MTDEGCCETSVMVRIHPKPKYGDANESAAHIKGIEIAARALGELAQRPSSPVHRVERYWSPRMSGHGSISLGWVSTTSPW